MKKILRFGLSSLCVFGALSLSAQERYYEEIFSDSEVMVEKNVVYGTNVDFMKNTQLLDPTYIQGNIATIGAEVQGLKTAVQTGGTIDQSHYTPVALDNSTLVKVSDLRMDVYYPDPSVDTETERPVLFYVHTGNFLPPVINGGVGGSKEDSAAVELCTQWAKRGYVAVAMNYRHGWNPAATGPTGTIVRRATLLNAVYRAIHDVKASVRYMRNDAINGANNYEISTSNVGIYGQGSGGYVTLAYNTLDDLQTETSITKFLIPDGSGGFTSIINPQAAGDIDGFDGLLSLYYDQGLSADIEVCLNAGGALADNSWIDGNEAPFVSIHAIRDQFAPFDTGTVIVPTTGGEVVDVNGPNMFMPLANSLGVNDVFDGIEIMNGLGYDPYTDRARSMYGNTYSNGIPPININDPINLSVDAEGLFALDLEEGNGAPWEWWSLSDLQTLVGGVNAATGGSYDAQTIHSNALLSNPNMSKALALTYIDSIQGYIHPRIMRAMEIGNFEALNVNEVDKLSRTTSVYPNPASGDVFISSTEAPVSGVRILDIEGRVVYNTEVVSQFNHAINVSGFTSGVYFVQLEMEGNRIVKKLIIQ